MSASTQLQALLLAAPAVTALCGTRIAADRMEQGSARPFVVHSASVDVQRGLDGSIHGRQSTIEIQCWADTRAAANALAEAVQTALDAVHQYTSGPVQGYDAELDLECAILTTSWWDD